MLIVKRPSFQRRNEFRKEGVLGKTPRRFEVPKNLTQIRRNMGIAGARLVVTVATKISRKAQMPSALALEDCGWRKMSVSTDLKPLDRYEA